MILEFGTAEEPMMQHFLDTKNLPDNFQFVILEKIDNKFAH